MATSGIAGGTAGTGVFAARRFADGEDVAPFFGAIIYTDLGAKTNRTVRYASSVLGSYGPTAQECAERALAVSVRPRRGGDAGGALPPRSQWPSAPRPGAAGPSRGATRAPSADSAAGEPPLDVTTVWIVPSACCVGGYVNDCTVVSKVDQAAAASSSSAVPRAHANVHIRVCPKVGGDDATIDDLLSPDAIKLVACRDISPGEEVVAWYGTEYGFLYDEEVRGGRASGGALVSRSTPHTFASI